MAGFTYTPPKIPIPQFLTPKAKVVEDPKKKKTATTPVAPALSAKAESGFAMRDEILKRAGQTTTAPAATPTAPIGASTATPTKPVVTAPVGTTAKPTVAATVTPPAAPAPAATTPAPEALKSDKQALIDKLLSAITTKSSFDEGATRTKLEEEAGLGKLTAGQTRLRQERDKTLSLLDELESDIKKRTGGFIVPEAAQRRIEASERNPLLAQLGITERGLGTIGEEITGTKADIDAKLGLAKTAAGQGLEDLTTEIQGRKTIDDVFKKPAETELDTYTDVAGNRISVLYDSETRETRQVNLGKAKPEGGSITGAVTEAGLIGPDSFKAVLSASKGGKAPVADERKALTKAFLVVDQLDTLTTSVNDTLTGPIIGAIRSGNPFDTKAQVIKANLISIIPNLARGVFGEVGVLTDHDIATYSQTLPNLSSTKDVRDAIVGLTLKTVQRSIENQLEVLAASGIDVSGFVNKYTALTNLIETIENRIGVNDAGAGGGEGGGGDADVYELDGVNYVRGEDGNYYPEQ